MNDTDGFHVKAEHVLEALESARGGFIPEGNVGGGTGMLCHGFKGGTGTASRVLSEEDGGYTVGVLVQANHGRRENLTVSGVPVGNILTGYTPINPAVVPKEGTGSIIVVVATNAPVWPMQLTKMCRRVSIGIGRVGGGYSNSSGDIFIAFPLRMKMPIPIQKRPLRSWATKGWTLFTKRLPMLRRRRS